MGIIICLYAIIFLLGLLVGSVVAVHDCQSIVSSNESGKYNKSFINCNSEPVLNTTLTNNTTVVNELRIFNYTFNDTLISSAIENQTQLINTYKSQVSQMNYTQALLLLENEMLRTDNLKFKSVIPSYEILSQMYNSSQQSLIFTQSSLQSEKGNKVLYLSLIHI